MEVEDNAPSYSRNSYHDLLEELAWERKLNENLRTEVNRIKNEREVYRKELENANKRALEMRSELFQEKLDKGRIQSELDDLKGENLINSLVLESAQKTNSDAPRQASVKPELEVYLKSNDEDVKDSIGLSIIPGSSSSSRTRKRSNSTQSDDFKFFDPTPIINDSIASRKRQRHSGSVHPTEIAQPQLLTFDNVAHAAEENKIGQFQAFKFELGSSKAMKRYTPSPVSDHILLGTASMYSTVGWDIALQDGQDAPQISSQASSSALLPTPTSPTSPLTHLFASNASPEQPVLPQQVSTKYESQPYMISTSTSTSAPALPSLSLSPSYANPSSASSIVPEEPLSVLSSSRSSRSPQVLCNTVAVRPEEKTLSEPFGSAHLIPRLPGAPEGPLDERTNPAILGAVTVTQQKLKKEPPAAKEKYQVARSRDPLWAATVATLLSATPPFPIHPAADTNFVVARIFLNHCYGINTGSFMAIMKPDRNPTSNSPRSILFPFFEENPDLPVNPGDPGIILTAREDMLEIQPVSIFINYKGRGKGPSLWLYAGNYALENVQNLTGEQFSRLPEQTQNRWATTILDRKREVWSMMRARIYLRKQGIPLTEGNVSIEHIKIMKKKDPGYLDVKDIVAAFIQEYEHINIIRMKCVGYDHEFVEDLKTRNEIWKKNPKKVVHDINPSKSGVAGSSSSSTAPVLRRTGKDRRSTALVSAPVTAGLRRSTRQRSSINYVDVDDDCDNARVPSDVASAENDRLISDLTQGE